ncbi:MAG: HAD-IIIC family phosphatase [Candidatus Hodarchaeota archaeon]
MKIALLSNVNMDSLARKLNKDYSVYSSPGYGTWVQELMNKQSNLYEFEPEAIIVILDAEELIRGKNDIDEIKSLLDEQKSYLISALAEIKSIPLFVSDFDLPPKKLASLKSQSQERVVEDYWYRTLVTLNDTYSNFYIFDLKSLIEYAGRRTFYSEKLWYLGGIKYSVEGESILQTHINRYLNAIKGHRKKCLVLDLDNTLWGGIAGEDGLNGIILSDFGEGARYKDFQKRLKEIKELGVLLTIISKNNEDDAMEIIRHHPDMILKADDFAATKINWQLKSINITELAQDLNLDVDSFVFIDDNPVERESVKLEHPRLTVPQFPIDSSQLPSFINQVYYDYFLIANYTQEDVIKTQMYKQNVRRAELMKSTPSLEKYLQSLDTKIYVWKAKTSDVTRVSQLTQKTNQFNMTTRRYTELDIQNFMHSDDYDVYVIASEDKFGDNGKVATVILKKNKDNTAEIDTFLLSCRIMGRFMEDQILSYVEDQSRQDGIRKMKAYYIPTAKNIPAEDFFERMNYQIIRNESTVKEYILDLDKSFNDRKSFGEVIES